MSKVINLPSPIKPFGDTRIYDQFVLPNGLQVMLIHDGTATVSACAMRVNIGNMCDDYITRKTHPLTQDINTENNEIDKNQASTKNDQNNPMSVKSSLNDPLVFSNPSIYGLAHFCEHLLFTTAGEGVGNGSKLEQNNGKSSNTESYYKQLISKYAGQCNASTGSETTTYHFAVNTNGFEEVIECFANFFTKPRFNRNMVEREMNAVHSEHTRNIQSDGRRGLSILRHITNELHPFANFRSGDNNTLKYYLNNINIIKQAEYDSENDNSSKTTCTHEKSQNFSVSLPDTTNHATEYLVRTLEEYHHSLYNPSLMKLCVSSNHPLPYLKALITAHFSSIPSNPTDYVTTIDISTLSGYNHAEKPSMSQYYTAYKQLTIKNRSPNAHFPSLPLPHHMFPESPNINTMTNIPTNIAQTYTNPLFNPTYRQYSPPGTFSTTVFELTPISNTRNFSMKFYLPLDDQFEALSPQKLNEIDNNFKFTPKDPLNKNHYVGTSSPTPDYSEFPKKSEDIISPIDLLSYLLNCKHLGSLSYILKKMGLVLSFDAGIYISLQTFNIFSIDCALTVEGMKQIPTIANLIYRYLYFIYSSLLNDDNVHNILEWLRTKLYLKNFKTNYLWENPSPISDVRCIVDSMGVSTPLYVLQANYPEWVNLYLLKVLLSFILHPNLFYNNCVFFISSRDCDKDIRFFDNGITKDVLDHAVNPLLLPENVQHEKLEENVDSIENQGNSNPSHSTKTTSTTIELPSTVSPHHEVTIGKKTVLLQINPLKLSHIPHTDLNLLYSNKKWHYDFIHKSSYAFYTLDGSKSKSDNELLKSIISPTKATEEEKIAEITELIRFIKFSSPNHDEENPQKSPINEINVEILGESKQENPLYEDDLEYIALLSNPPYNIFQLPKVNKYVPKSVTLYEKEEDIYDIYHQINREKQQHSSTNVMNAENTASLNDDTPETNLDPIQSWPLYLGEKSDKFYQSYSQFSHFLHSSLHNHQFGTNSDVLTLYKPPNTELLFDQIFSHIKSTHNIDLLHPNSTEPIEYTLFSPENTLKLLQLIKNNEKLNKIGVFGKDPYLPNIDKLFARHGLMQEDPFISTKLSALEVELEQVIAKEKETCDKKDLISREEKSIFQDPVNYFSKSKKLLQQLTLPSHLPVPLPSIYFAPTPNHSDTPNSLPAPPIELWHKHTPHHPIPEAIISVQIPLVHPQIDRDAGAVNVLWQFLQNELAPHMEPFRQCYCDISLSHDPNMLGMQLHGHYDLLPKMLDMFFTQFSQILNISNIPRISVFFEAKHRKILGNIQAASSRTQCHEKSDEFWTTSSGQLTKLMSLEYFLPLSLIIKSKSPTLSNPYYDNLTETDESTGREAYLTSNKAIIQFRIAYLLYKLYFFARNGVSVVIGGNIPQSYAIRFAQKVMYCVNNNVLPHAPGLFDQLLRLYRNIHNNTDNFMQITTLQPTNTVQKLEYVDILQTPPTPPDSRDIISQTDDLHSLWLTNCGKSRAQHALSLYAYPNLRLYENQAHTALLPIQTGNNGETTANDESRANIPIKTKFLTQIIKNRKTTFNCPDDQEESDVNEVIYLQLNKNKGDLQSHVYHSYTLEPLILKAPISSSRQVHQFSLNHPYKFFLNINILSQLLKSHSFSFFRTKLQTGYSVSANVIPQGSFSSVLNRHNLINTLYSPKPGTNESINHLQHFNLNMNQSFSTIGFDVDITSSSHNTVQLDQCIEYYIHYALYNHILTNFLSFSTKSTPSPQISLLQPILQRLQTLLLLPIAYNPTATSLHHEIDYFCSSLAYWDKFHFSPHNQNHQPLSTSNFEGWCGNGIVKGLYLENTIIGLCLPYIFDPIIFIIWVYQCLWNIKAGYPNNIELTEIQDKTVHEDKLSHLLDLIQLQYVQKAAVHTAHLKSIDDLSAVLETNAEDKSDDRTNAHITAYLEAYTQYNHNDVIVYQHDGYAPPRFIIQEVIDPPHQTHSQQTPKSTQ